MALEGAEALTRRDRRRLTAHLPILVPPILVPPILVPPIRVPAI